MLVFERNAALIVEVGEQFHHGFRFGQFRINRHEIMCTKQGGECGGLPCALETLAIDEQQHAIVVSPHKRKAAGWISAQRQVSSKIFTQFRNLDRHFRLPIHIGIFARAVILPEPARKGGLIEHFPGYHQRAARRWQSQRFHRDSPAPVNSDPRNDHRLASAQAHHRTSVRSVHCVKVSECDTNRPALWTNSTFRWPSFKCFAPVEIIVAAVHRRACPIGVPRLVRGWRQRAWPPIWVRCFSRKSTSGSARHFSFRRSLSCVSLRDRASSQFLGCSGSSQPLTVSTEQTR